VIQSTEIERAIAVQVITETFDANPSVNIVIGDRGNRKKKISRLADYTFTKALNRKGAFISSNERGAALCFRSDIGKSTLKELFYEVRFALSIPLKKVFQTLKRESYLKKHRYQGTHLYFWFLGVYSVGQGAVYELKDHIFDWSDREQLPILLETSVPRNRDIYIRYGFEVYYTWEDSGGGAPLWFMMRKPL
jgi:hypothetical protein